MASPPNGYVYRVPMEWRVLAHVNVPVKKWKDMDPATILYSRRVFIYIYIYMYIESVSIYERDDYLQRHMGVSVGHSPCHFRESPCHSTEGPFAEVFGTGNIDDAVP